MLFLFGTQSRRLSGSGTRGRRNPGFADLSRAESRSAAICGRQNCGILWLTMRLRHPSEVEGSRCVSFKVSRGSLDFARDDGMYGNAARTCSASGASLYQRSQTGRFRSGQTGQTVNLLALRLRWFEASPAHFRSSGDNRTENTNKALTWHFAYDLPPWLPKHRRPMSSSPRGEEGGEGGVWFSSAAFSWHVENVHPD